jgi:hypothetical protein
MVIAHEVDAAIYISDMLRRFHTHDPFGAPKLKRDSDRKFQFRDREGYIEVHSASNFAGSRSRTLQYIHASEPPYWSGRGSGAALSFLNAVRDIPGTTIIEEGTANGQDPYFYPRWRGAHDNCKLTWTEKDGGLIPKLEVTNEKEWNHCIALFLSALDNQSCYREFLSEELKTAFLHSMDHSELHLLDAFQMKPEFLNFRRWAIKYKCSNEEDLFDQEYPITPEVAFLTSGRPRFDRKALNEMPISDFRLGTLVRSDKWNREISFREDPGGLIKIYQDPIPGHRYVIGADIAEGRLADGSRTPDASVGIVLDRDRGGMQVAKVAGQISEEHFVDPLLMLAEHYNGAYAVIESNSTGKHVCIQAAKRYPPTRLFYRADYDAESKSRSHVPGWRTTSANRPVLISAVASAIFDRGVLITDKKTQDECLHFVYKDGGRVEADNHYHDDEVIALGLAVIGMNSYPDHLRPTNRQGTMFDDRIVISRQRTRKTASRLGGY